MSQQSGGSWGRYAILAIAVVLLITVPGIKTLIMTILEGLK